MNRMPPAMRPKDASSSVGGLEGYIDCGGFKKTITYVKALAKDAAVSMLPHCLCTMPEIMLCCVCELIMMPSNRITRAGIGFKEKA
jgi:hypothetical protein